VHAIRVLTHRRLTLRDVPRRGDREATGAPLSAPAAHADHMAPPTTPRPPGSMTVPPLFGWEFILVGLLLLVALAVAFFVLSAAGRNVSERAELQAWLDARSQGRGRTATDDPREADPTSTEVPRRG
jgi:hypothetical protein